MSFHESQWTCDLVGNKGGLQGQTFKANELSFEEVLL